MKTGIAKIQSIGSALVLFALLTLAERPASGKIHVFFCKEEQAKIFEHLLTITDGKANLEFVSAIETKCWRSPFDDYGTPISFTYVSNPTLGAGGNQNAARATATPGPSLITLFQWTAPLLLAPQFPAGAVDNLTADCPSSLQAYQVNHTGGLLTVVGLCPFRLIKRISIPSSPLQVAITPDASQALVTGYDGTLTFIDVATNNVTFTMDLGNYNPHGIAISRDGTRAYVTHYLDISPSLLVIDIPNRKLLSTIPMPFVYPRVITLTPDGSQAWINYFGGGVVTVVDLMTGTLAGSVNIGQLVSTGIAFNTTGTKAYVAVEPDQIYVVDTALLTVKKRITVGNGPLDIVVAPTGDRVYVGTEFDPALWAIDPVTDTLQFKAVDPTRNTGGNRGLLIFP